MIGRFERAPDVDAWASRLAITLAMRPDASTHPARLQAVAELALKADLQDLWNHLALALAEIRSGRGESAAGRLEKLRTSPEEATRAWFANQPSAWPILALAYSASNRRDEALRWLDRADDWALRRGREGPVGGLGEGSLRGSSRNDLATFLALRREAWSAIRGTTPPEDHEARLAAGSVRAAMGLDDSARADLEAAVADPRLGEQPRPWIELGHLLARAGRLEQAERAFARASALAPDDLQPFLERTGGSQARSRPGASSTHRPTLTRPAPSRRSPPSTPPLDGPPHSPASMAGSTSDPPSCPATRRRPPR